MRFDVLARELDPMWTLAQSDFHCFGFCVFDFPAVAQHAPDHPERADANRGRAMDERRAIFRIVSDLQELCDLFFIRIAVRDGDVEVFQAELFRFRFFFGGAMLAWLAQVDNCFDAVRFEFLEMLEFWLAAGAEVLIDAEEVADFTGVLR